MMCEDHNTRDVKFGNQIGSDWPQMGQIVDFLRSDSVHFGPQHLAKIYSGWSEKNPRIVTLLADLTQFGCQICHHCFQRVNTENHATWQDQSFTPKSEKTNRKILKSSIIRVSNSIPNKSGNFWIKAGISDLGKNWSSLTRADLVS